MTRWLTEDEQRSWRAWLSASVLLTDRLSRDLQEQHGLTIADYEILVRLSEIPDRRMRMSELADATLSSRSRLSHQIDRMERAGLVATEKVGRVRTCRLGPSRLESETAWMDTYRRLWAARFDALDEVLGELQRKEKTVDERKKRQ